jgi:hypothetical protein
MKRKTVTIEIDESGNSSLDLDGFEGQGCGDVAREFQGADAVTTAQNKREFYSTRKVDSHLRQGKQP